MSEIIPSRIVRVPIKSIEKPRQGMCCVFLDYWWVVDPETNSVIFYRRHDARYASPQFNGNKPVAEKILESIWKTFGYEIRQVPVTLLPIWTTGDYDFGYELHKLLDN